MRIFSFPRFHQFVKCGAGDFWIADEDIVQSGTEEFWLAEERGH